MRRQRSGLDRGMPPLGTTFNNAGVVAYVRADCQRVPRLGGALDRVHHVALCIRIHIPEFQGLNITGTDEEKTFSIVVFSGSRSEAVDFGRPCGGPAVFMLLSLGDRHAERAPSGWTLDFRNVNGVVGDGPIQVLLVLAFGRQYLDRFDRMTSEEPISGFEVPPQIAMGGNARHLRSVAVDVQARPRRVCRQH